jgi:serine/threonine protein kinase
MELAMIGKTLAHYEITSLLGRGGMGEVYKAKDQKLGRHVAIKVLPEEFAKDADRVARFQREAKLLASLNHPNIASIYGLEESDGTHFLVLELVEGDTLANRIKEGPIPVEEALKLALQIAEALEAAHEKGVIHRDLKPANIKVTPEGKVKVLDFGLAKAFSGEQAEVNLSHSPTLSEAATMQGVILGTAAYMSPEQARGKPVDKRTDIWAFGCVLYEMLTGQTAFQGEDVTEILAAVVKSGVNLDLLPANINSRVREVLTRCLQKEQKKRYRDIGEAQYEIEQVLADPSGMFVQPVTAAEPRRNLRTRLPWIAAAVILSAITGAVVWNLRMPEPRQVTRFSYELPENQQFSDLTSTVLAVSPDGKRFAFTSLRDGNFGVHWKAADGTGKVELLGSVPGRLIIPNSWSSDGKALLLTEWSSLPPRFDVMVLSMEGNHARRMLLHGKHSESQPRISPNGQWLAYASDESGHNEIYIHPFPDIDKGRWQVSTNGGDSPLWSPDGRELFYRNDDAVMAVSVKAEPNFSLETPKLLFRGTYASYAAKVIGQLENNPWDIHPDGKRFLMMKPSERTEEESITNPPRKIIVVTNWFEELKERVPVP